MMLLQWRRPDLPILTGWRGPDGTLAATVAANPGTTVPTLIGPPGLAGPVGPAGPSGIAGSAGVTGSSGATGATGPVGAVGPAGAQGVAGPQGSVGPQGPPGASVGDPWNWVKLTADVVNSTVALAAIPDLLFTAAANTTYLVQLVGTFQSAATTTGTAVALDIPSGSVTGQMLHSTTVNALGGSGQNSDSAVTGVTTGVRAANENTAILASFIVATGAVGGTVQLLFRSEVAASAVTMKAASTVMGWRAI